MPALITLLVWYLIHVAKKVSAISRELGRRCLPAGFAAALFGGGVLGGAGGGGWLL